MITLLCKRIESSFPIRLVNDADPIAASNCHPTEALAKMVDV